MMIVPVDEKNILQAAAVHSASWQDSHRLFCTAEFIERHTPEYQGEYLRRKIGNGSRIYMLVEEEPAGIVSVTGRLIEDLYVYRQGRGYGKELLKFAVSRCDGVPALWILENNERAAGFYRSAGFRETGRKKISSGRIAEIEFSKDET